jgi:hypothetical protein
MNPNTKNRIAALLSEIRTLLDDPDKSDEFEPDKLNEFLDANVLPAPGNKILFKEFRERFAASLPANKRRQWSPQKIKILVTCRYQVGPSTANKNHIFDACWSTAQ